MPYLTMFVSPSIHQISIDELLSGTVDLTRYRVFPSKRDNTNTRTISLPGDPGDKVFSRYPILDFYHAISAFNAKYADLIDSDLAAHYSSFLQPKSSGGYRRIDAPDDQLKEALYDLKKLFESQGWALYHTAAFAYIRGRCAIDAVRRHQRNESHWFLKLDFHNFFGSTTPEFLMEMLAQIFPFSCLCEIDGWRETLRRALSLCFLNGGLPQGTPISPLLSNLMMIPIDYRLANALRNYDDRHFTYTRYADDILISCRQDFRFDSVVRLITDTLKEFHAPFHLNREKTRYGSRSGSNWNLGVMLNRDNQITIGHKRKQQFRAILTSYVLDRQHQKPWSLYDVQVLMGQLNYYSSVEPDAIAKMIRDTNEKFSADLMRMIRADLRGAQ